MVLRSSKAPVPAAFYNGMAASQIEVLAEVVMPTASSTTNFTGLPPLDKEAMRIKTIGTKVLIILVDTISIYYTLHEAMRWAWTGGGALYACMHVCVCAISFVCPVLVLSLSLSLSLSLCVCVSVCVSVFAG